MRFNSIIMKDMLRFTKEYGLYNQFKTEFRKYTTTHGLLTEKQLIEYCNINTPLLLYILNIRQYYAETDYDNALSYYLYEKYKNNFIKLFEKFLEENNIKNIFFNNVKFCFIKEQGNIIGKFLKLKEYEKPQDNVYENMAPIGFIMNSFHWASTPQGRDYWSTLNTRWRVTILNFIKDGKYKE